MLEQMSRNDAPVATHDPSPLPQRQSVNYNPDQLPLGYPP